MFRRSFKLVFLPVITFLAIAVLLGVVTNVPTNISKSDEAVFRSILALERPSQILSFDEQIALIERVQRQVIRMAPAGDPIPEYQNREPEDLFLKRSGLCYDRSRTFDKLFNWLGFESRHVYILYPEHPRTKEVLPYWMAFFVRGTKSHAVTEIKTKKGWMLVDSNSPWISLTKKGEPVNSDDIPARAREFSQIPDYFDRPYMAIRGLYSRHGNFYRPHIPSPELNWADFLSWIFGISS